MCVGHVCKCMFIKGEKEWIKESGGERDGWRNTENKRKPSAKLYTGNSDSSTCILYDENV